MLYNGVSDSAIHGKITRGVKMLINFKVKNFLSIKDLQEFSMVAGQTKRKYERVVPKAKFGILKFSAIYGANASGKSNLVKALEIMKRIVTKGMPKYVYEGYFKLDKTSVKDNTYFEVELSIEDKNYAYGFQVNFSNNEIVDEWLIEMKNTKEESIFERDVRKGEIKHKPFSSKVSRNLEVYVDDLKKDKNILFLTYLNKSKSGFYEETETQVFKNIYTWFERYLDIADPDSTITSGDYIFVEERLKLLSNLLESFDTGITKICREDSTSDEFNRLIPTKIFDQIKEDMQEKQDTITKPSKISSLIRVNNNFIIVNFEKDKSFSFEKVCFYHNDTPLSLSDESHGTIRLLDLAEILLTDEHNKTYVIDELDRCLHPQITCKFVELFLAKSAEKDFNNQLIVTTHESRLLDFEILRRDEIWFTDKKDGKTSLYSLEQFNERFDKKIDKAYLDGRYGGVPIFDTIFPTFNKGSKNESKFQE